MSRGTNRFDHPLSSRFDEQDAFVIFDDVEVPRERIFIDGNLDVYNQVMSTSWFPNIMQQTMIRAQTKLEFAYGLGCKMAEVIGDKTPATLELLGELFGYAELARAAIRTAEAEAFECGQRRLVPERRSRCSQLRHFLPVWLPRVNEILRLIGSHNLLATPTESQLRDPELGPLIAKYLQGADGRVGRDTHPCVPARLGLRGERARQPQRAVRALLPGVGGAQSRARAPVRAEGARAQLVERFLEEKSD